MKNSGTVSDIGTDVDLTRLSRFIGGKSSLVAQGGGQKGIFTAGVLDAFLLSNFDPYREYFGTSAGALNLCAFLCRQHGLAKAFITELTTDQTFFNLFGYIRRKHYLDLDWALDKITSYPYRLDIDMGRRVITGKYAFAAVTDSVKLTDHYFPMLGEDWRRVLTASCAIPGLYQHEVPLNGGAYIDGGVSASIPVQEAWRREARFITVIRTESSQTEADTLKEARLSVTDDEVKWYRDSFNALQTQWQQQVTQWKENWNEFFRQQIARSKQLKNDQPHLEALNGGRWLFGASDIYRLSHLFGNKFDAGLADMLMVHYQTYELTSEFLSHPPDDVFIVQIMPEEPLQSSSLLSKVEDLAHDYQVGLKAGIRFVDTFTKADSMKGIREADFQRRYLK